MLRQAYSSDNNREGVSFKLEVCNYREHCGGR